MTDSLFVPVLPQKITNPNIMTESDRKARVFNTALIASKMPTKRDFNGEFAQLVASPAFQAILLAVDTLQRSQGLSEAEAVQQVLYTFRKLDSLWDEYFLADGIGRLNGPKPPS